VRRGFRAFGRDGNGAVREAVPVNINPDTHTHRERKREREREIVLVPDRLWGGGGGGCRQAGERSRRVRVVVRALRRLKSHRTVSSFSLLIAAKKDSVLSPPPPRPPPPFLPWKHMILCQQLRVCVTVCQPECAVGIDHLRSFQLDADLALVASFHNMAVIEVTVQSDSDAGAKRLTVDPAQSVHEAIAEAFGCKSQQQVQRVLFGDTDVLEGESFEDHGVEVGVTHSRRTVQCLLSFCLAP
jgi:hypothetical protein